MLHRYRTEYLNCDSLIDLHYSEHNKVLGDVMNKSLQIPSVVVWYFIVKLESCWFFIVS